NLRKGHNAPGDLHPTRARKIGVKRVNYGQRLPYDCKDTAKDPEDYLILFELYELTENYLKLPTLLPEEYPVWAKYANSLPLGDIPPAYPFTGLVINFCVSTSAHRDHNDEGLCAVIPFGEFTGGELCLFEPGLVFDIKPGDILIFPSAEITHFNLH
ncbi:hypothetical protein BDN72DRAFT_746285, partial [Pluteus cervinus]